MLNISFQLKVFLFYSLYNTVGNQIKQLIHGSCALHILPISSKFTLCYPSVIMVFFLVLFSFTRQPNVNRRQRRTQSVQDTGNTPQEERTLASWFQCALRQDPTGLGFSSTQWPVTPSSNTWQLVQVILWQNPSGEITAQGNQQATQGPVNYTRTLPSRRRRKSILLEINNLDKVFSDYNASARNQNHQMHRITYPSALPSVQHWTSSRYSFNCKVSKAMGS